MKRALALLLATAAAAAWAYQAVARDRDYRALLVRGDAALQQEQAFTAIEAYSGAIARRPDSMIAHLRRGEAYQRNGSLEEAARDFRRAAALAPTATRPLEALGDVLYRMGRFGRAADAYASTLQIDDRLDGVSYKLALARYRDGAILAALAAIERAIALNGARADAYYLRGLCLRDRRRAAEAVEALEQAVARAPGLIAAREELADLYGELGRRVDELEQLQVIAGLDKDHVERQVAVAIAHAQAGHPDLAVLTLGNALERTPDQPLIYGALGRVWLGIALARDDRVALSKALEALERIASSPGATSETLALYGRALLRGGETEAAERVLQQAIARAPVDPGAYLLSAAAAERLNHLEEARAALIAYGGLVADDPDMAARAARIGALSLRLNDPQAAVSWFAQAAGADPRDLPLRVALADAQIRAGRLDAARATVAAIREADPANAALPALARRMR
ncbi:MAG: tetratricopeptide repeat protein [Acidobacteria bacterium]|nr:tetratricopeptide repeat protein [Acidobacteriota bacterium]